MVTHCQTAVQSPSAERQKSRGVNSFEGKKRGGQLLIKNLITIETCRMCVFSLYIVEYITLIT